MNRLDLCPLQESYAVQFGCSVQRNELPGGFSRYTTVTPSKKHLVSISYNLTEPDYQYFRAFYLNWQLNPLPFLMKLYVEDSEFKDYICQFVPDSFSFDALSGKIFSVSAQLVVVISPVVVLTTNTYPIYLLELLNTDFNIDPAVSFDPISVSDDVTSDFNVLDAQYPTEISYVVADGPIDSVANDIAVLDAQYTYEVTYRETPPQTDSASSTFSILNAVISNDLITNNAEQQSVSSAFLVTDAQYM